MIPCKECSKLISPTSKSCVKCGDTAILQSIEINIEIHKNLLEKAKDDADKIKKESYFIEAQISLAKHKFDSALEKELTIKLKNNEYYQSINGEEVDGMDAMFVDAAQIVVLNQEAYDGFLVRKLKLEYDRAGRIIDQLESHGVIGSVIESGTRDVLISDLESLDDHMKRYGFYTQKKFGSDIYVSIYGKEKAQEFDRKQVISKAQSNSKTNEKSEKKGCAFTFISISIIMLSIGYYFI